MKWDKILLHYLNIIKLNTNFIQLFEKRRNEINYNVFMNLISIQG